MHLAQKMKAKAKLVGGARQYAYHLGNPLTTSNVVPGKSRIRFLRVPGGIFLKILCGKINDFLRFTSTRHKCFEKDLFTIVVAMSTESYFSLHFC